MFKWIVIVAALLLVWLAYAWPSHAGTPLPTSNQVYRTTPASCPLASIPVVNSQGTSGAPVSVQSGSTTVIPGNGNRVAYYLECTADTQCEFGTTLNVAPTTTPTATVGFLFKANTNNAVTIFPGNRLDCITVSGADVCYTIECNP